MSDENPNATDPTATTTTASTPGNQPDDTVNLTKAELADLLRKAANNSAAQTRHRLEADPKLQRAKQLASLYDEAFRPEPARTEPAKPTGSKLEQLLETFLTVTIAERMPKAPAPAAAAPVPVGARVDEAVRQATRGLEKGTPSYHDAARKAALAVLRTVKVRGG